MQSGDTLIIMDPLPLVDGEAAQYSISLATSPLIVKTVIALIASDAGVSVMLAEITVPQAYSVRQRRSGLRGE